MRPKQEAAHTDDRTERRDAPQYQHPEDERLARGGCRGCVFLQDPARAE